jgi:hypothetical protein
MLSDECARIQVLRFELIKEMTALEAKVDAHTHWPRAVADRFAVLSLEQGRLRDEWLRLGCTEQLLINRVFTEHSGDDRTEERIDPRPVYEIEATSARLAADYHLTSFVEANYRVPKSSLELDEWLNQQGIKITTDALAKHVAKHYERLKAQGFL